MRYMDKILRFTSPTCQPCKTIARTLECMELDIPIEVIDISKNSEAIDNYSIKSVPTLVYKGNSLVGNKSAKEIYEWLADIE